MSLKSKKVGNTTVELDFANCPDDGGKYQLTCSNHSYLIQHNNKKSLWRFADEVSNWCEACAGNDPRYTNEKWVA